MKTPDQVLELYKESIDRNKTAKQRDAIRSKINSFLNAQAEEIERSKPSHVYVLFFAYDYSKYIKAQFIEGVFSEDNNYAKVRLQDTNQVVMVSFNRLMSI